MIFQLGLWRNRYAMLGYEVHHGLRWEAARMRPIYYEHRKFPRTPEPGLYIFTDIELMTPEERVLASEWWTILQADPERYRTWNDPERCLRRFDLLKELAASGQNDFRAFRVNDPWPDDLRYPVFLRNENIHAGPITDLLHNRDQVVGALAALAHQRKRAADPLLIVEYLDFADERGVFRKYGVLRMGDHLLAKHLYITRGWVPKLDYLDFANPDFLAEEVEFTRTNPHEQIIRSIFDLARIEHGRIDYTVVNGKVQVFEINSNPTIFGLDRKLVQRSHEGPFTEGYFSALREIDTSPEIMPAEGMRWVCRGSYKRYFQPTLRKVKRRLLPWTANRAGVSHLERNS